MGTFSRWSTSFVAHINAMIQKVENHEALADVTICDMQRAAGRAKAHLARVKRETASLERSINQQREEVACWEARAVAVAQEDREKARACIARKREAERKYDQLHHRYAEQHAAQETLEADVKHIIQKIDDLKRKRQVLQSRQSRTEAIKAVHAVDSGQTHVDDVFDRWEFSIIEEETVQGLHSETTDALEEDFRREEEAQAIDAELDALLATSGSA